MIPDAKVNAGRVDSGTQRVTEGSAIPHKAISLATVNNTLVKAGVATLTKVAIFNTVASIRYIKFYDKLTAPVAGTDVPVQTYQIPASGSLILSPQIGFLLGLGYALTALVADNDTTAVGAGDLVVNLGYN